MDSCLIEQPEDVTALPLESETKTITQCSGCKTDVYYEFDVEEVLESDTDIQFLCKDCFYRMLKNRKTDKSIMEFS